MLLKWLGHPTQHHHVRASAMVKDHYVFNSLLGSREVIGENQKSCYYISPFTSPLSLFSGIASPIFYLNVFFAITRNFNQFISFHLITK